MHKHLPKLTTLNLIMRELNYDLKKMCARNKDGSYSTQSSRGRRLQKIANILHEKGYRKMSAQSLKPKHIDALIEHWRAEKTSVGTIKNYMSSLRWWAEKINKPAIIARDNSHYGIADRVMVSNLNKGQSLDIEKLSNVTDEHVKISLQLQSAFGLRREESIKFIPSYADKGSHIILKSTWTKGGKEREIEIKTDYQREVLKAAHKLAGKGSLIPSNRKFIQQLKIYEGHTIRAGLSKLHGLRHRFAQEMYLEKTGWNAPVCGGPKSKELSKVQKAIDRQARLEISKALGHEREQITAIYLGR
ncbi:phage integrase N-terminal domain-containing protein [Aliikangiella maris]|uniref:Phage integrase N-terminal domain-containing protein n=2 Tax=Aliikangiella maris TaxID=3162458 RepID=A0ABV3MTX5_9GAMM